MIDTVKFTPEYLKLQKCWVLWMLGMKNGRMTKVPCSISEKFASSTDSETWTTYNKAIHTLKNSSWNFSGCGIVVHPDNQIVFIDIDHCILDGELSDLAKDILNHIPLSFVEVSQSGTGLHILTLGKIPKNFKNSANGVEMYYTARFCACTFRAYRATEPQFEQDGIDYVYAKYKTPEKVPKRTSQSNGCTASDNEIIAKASSHGRFSDLYSGNWNSAGYNSHSEADSALCTILAFWTNADSSAIDRIFRSSGLYREKWERVDYRASTIDGAIGALDETLSEFIDRKYREEVKRREELFLSE